MLGEKAVIQVHTVGIISLHNWTDLFLLPPLKFRRQQKYNLGYPSPAWNNDTVVWQGLLNAFPFDVHFCTTFL